MNATAPPVTTRSLLPSFVGCFLYFSAVSCLLLLYRAYHAAHSIDVALTPTSRLSAPLQWMWLGSVALANLGIAIALMRGMSRAKPVLIGVTAVNAAVDLLTTTTSLGSTVWGLLIACVPAAVLVLSRVDIGPAAFEPDGGWRAARLAAGRLLYGLAAFVMLVTLYGLFNGQAPAHATATQSGAGVFILIGLSLMLVGGELTGQRKRAVREAGILLVALASYMVVSCTSSYVFLKLYWPRNPWHFFWDETLIWLIVIAMCGFALLALSEKHRPA
ncbi:hypothetical protein [Paraburkholderia sp.]|uniref:hypothetical protein n=1 Tax=Paraburkholderia sp. TaxID=1926495 RepID=UPI002390FE8D|nr:hypothetical protein [Paraburkholderia sp.]MDE1179935.1 hypothetical protein [Paraburkholderia sp.]